MHLKFFFTFDYLGFIPLDGVVGLLGMYGYGIVLILVAIR